MVAGRTSAGGMGGDARRLRLRPQNRTLLASTETLFCRLHKKVYLDVTLDLLEQDADTAGAVIPTQPAPRPERAPA